MLGGGAVGARCVDGRSASAGRPVEAVVYTAVEGLPLEECDYRCFVYFDSLARTGRVAPCERRALLPGERLQRAHAFEGSVRRTETAVVVVVGRVQAVAALLVHRALGTRGSHARRQQGGQAHLHVQLCVCSEGAGRARRLRRVNQFQCSTVTSQQRNQDWGVTRPGGPHRVMGAAGSGKDHFRGRAELLGPSALPGSRSRSRVRGRRFL